MQENHFFRKPKNIKHKNIIRRNNVSEVTKSIAEINNLKKCLGNFKFKALDGYLKSRIKILSQRKKISFLDNKLTQN